jgi:type VI protein secretion system component Hcp
MDSSEVYLDLRGRGGVQINGDVEAASYAGQIALYDWGWGMSLDEATPGSKDGSVLKSKVFNISKAVDASSTAMMNLMHSGELCEKAIITMAQRTEKSIMLRLVLKHVRLMDFTLEIDSDDTEVVMEEVWTLSFQEIEILYKGAELKQDVRGKVSNSALRSNSSFMLRLPQGAQFEPRPEKTDAMDAKDIARLIEASMSKQSKSGR